MKLVTWFKKGWSVGTKPGRWRFSTALPGRIAAFGFWLRRKRIRVKPEIEWLSQEEVDRLAGLIRPKPRGIITNGYK